MQSTVRARLADLALFVGAWWIRVGWMGRLGRRHAAVDPEDIRSVRQVFDGHERLLYEAFIGQAPTPSPQAWPLSIATHWCLGLLTDDPRALLWLAGTMGALTVVAVSMATRKRWGARAGLAAGLLVAVLPEHVAWSTSAIPVAHGLACLAGAAVVESRWARALLAALAAGFRPELAIPALFLGLPGTAAVVVAAGQLVWVGRPPAADLWPVLRVNLPLLAFVGPPVLGLALLAVRDRATVLLAVLAGSVHVVGASFSDYGGRHGVSAALALCVLAASGQRRLWLPVVVGLGLLPSLLDLQARWHHRDVLPEASLEHGVSEPCQEVGDEPPIPGQVHPSWVSMVSGALDGPCFFWGEAPEHTEWSSRGLRDRAIRMHYTWELSVIETHAPGQGRPWRRMWRVVGGPGVRDTMVAHVE